MSDDNLQGQLKVVEIAAAYGYCNDCLVTVNKIPYSSTEGLYVVRGRSKLCLLSLKTNVSYVFANDGTVWDSWRNNRIYPLDDFLKSFVSACYSWEIPS